MSRFQFHDPSQLWFPESLHHCTLVTDFNQRPVPSRMSWKPEQLSLDLLEDQCGRVHVMVPNTSRTTSNQPVESEQSIASKAQASASVPPDTNSKETNSAEIASKDTAAVLLSTPWLFPKISGYRLEIELIRGLIARLRSAAEMWRSNEIPFPPGFESQLAETTRQFISFWKVKSDDFASIESESFDFLQHLLGISRHLSDELLHRQGLDPFEPSTQKKVIDSGFTIAAAMEVSTASQFSATDQEENQAKDRLKIEGFSGSNSVQTVAVRQPWQPVARIADEEVRANAGYLESVHQKLTQSRKRCVVGPIFDVSRDALPSGQTLASDGEDLRSEIVNSIQHLLPPVATDTKMVHVVGGINGIGVNGLTPTIQAQLLIDALETANTIAPYTQLMISFDQPFCERHAWSVGGQTPEFFLTKLAKNRTPLHAIGLEFNIGFFPRGTLPRTDLDWIMLLHSWVMWEVPIYIMLRFPETLSNTGRSKTLSPVDGLTYDPQSANSIAQQTKHLVRLFSAMPWIHGIFFQGLTETHTLFPSPRIDAQQHAFDRLFI